MKKIFLTLSILVLLGIIYLIIINFTNYANINFIQDTLTNAQSQSFWYQHGAYLARPIRVSTFVTLILIAGIFVGAGTVYMFLDVAKDKVKAYQRELEKTSISGTTNASKVEVLEAKIKTLEKAFNTVIDERTQLELQIKNLNAEIDNINKNN